MYQGGVFVKDQNGEFVSRVLICKICGRGAAEVCGCKG